MRRRERSVCVCGGRSGGAEHENVASSRQVWPWASSERLKLLLCLDIIIITCPLRVAG